MAKEKFDYGIEKFIKSFGGGKYITAEEFKKIATFINRTGSVLKPYHFMSLYDYVRTRNEDWILNAWRIQPDQIFKTYGPRIDKSDLVDLSRRLGVEIGQLQGILVDKKYHLDESDGSYTRERFEGIKTGNLRSPTLDDLGEDRHPASRKGKGALYGGKKVG